MSERFFPSTVPRVEIHTSRCEVGADALTLMVLFPAWTAVGCVSAVVSSYCQRGDQAYRAENHQILVAVPLRDGGATVEAQVNRWCQAVERLEIPRDGSGTDFSGPGLGGTSTASSPRLSQNARPPSLLAG